MTSSAAAAAYAANAQLSTDPRTQAHQPNPSRGTVRYDRVSEQNFIAVGEEEEFAELYDSLIETLAPAGIVEMQQVDTILHAAWALRRVRTVEATLMEAGVEALFDERTAKTLDRLQRYGAHQLRTYESGLKVLRVLQTHRLARAAAAGHEEPVPCLVSVSEVAKETRKIAKRTQSRRTAAPARASRPVRYRVAPRVSPELQNEPTARAAASVQGAA
jgi:hypothetical protein